MGVGILTGWTVCWIVWDFLFVKIASAKLFLRLGAKDQRNAPKESTKDSEMRMWMLSSMPIKLFAGFIWKKSMLLHQKASRGLEAWYVILILWRLVIIES